MKYDLIYKFNAEHEDMDNLSFIERLGHHFDRRLERTFEHRMHPLRTISWRMQLVGDDEGIRSRYASMTKDALISSLRYGARESFVVTPLALAFLDWVSSTEEHVGNFFRNTINDVDEEEIDPLDLAYAPAEQRWWNKVSSGGTRYGIRPFRTSPYLYWGRRFGSRRSPFLQTELRYKLKSFETQVIEGFISVPFGDGLSWRIGGRHNFGEEEHPTRAVLRIQKTFKDGFAFIGTDLVAKPNFLLGFGRNW